MGTHCNQKIISERRRSSLLSRPHSLHPEHSKIGHKTPHRHSGMAHLDTASTVLMEHPDRHRGPVPPFRSPSISNQQSPIKYTLGPPPKSFHSSNFLRSPSFKDTFLLILAPSVADLLFGNDAYLNPSASKPFVKFHLYDFVLALLPVVWLAAEHGTTDCTDVLN